MKWLKNGEGKVLSFMQLSLHVILIKLKNLYTSACLNLNWHSKTDTKIVKGEKKKKMVGLMKTRNQYPHKFNVSHIFSSLFSPPFWRGNRFSKKTAWAKWAISFSPWSDDKNIGRVLLGEWVKMNRFNFLAH